MSEPYSCARLERGGTALALHSWTSARPTTVVFYIHGTQSHAGWLFETGPALARMGCVVYALERRGSGQSEGARGDVTSFRDWIDDYIEAMMQVRARHPELPMLLHGQSFGGAIAIGVACDPRASHDALTLSAPLIAPRIGFDLWKDVPDDQPVRMPAPDEWFTRDPRFLAFIRQDALMCRSITRRFQQARVDLAEHYMALSAPLAAKPAALILPQVDPMIDLPAARQVFQHVTGNQGIVIELPTTDHYIEFTSARELQWRIQASFAAAFMRRRDETALS
jgi:alpha-beta hydrolase superfamily lysophospholipase